VRHNSVQRALEQGTFRAMPTSVAIGLAVSGFVLGAWTIAALFV
jgi:hypothetical protein